jgi:hypothetical protein
MEYYINYNILTTIILLFIVLYFLSYYKEAPLFNKLNETFISNSHILNENDLSFENYNEVNNNKDIKNVVDAFEKNNYPCNAGYIVHSPDFWN